MSGERESAWLIEMPGRGASPSWWDGKTPHSFTYDPNDAFRMARRLDAERALSWELCKPPPGEVVITEHVWIGREHSTASARGVTG